MAEKLALTNTSSVLVIAAHPDDVKNCTGVVLRALGLGCLASVGIGHVPMAG